MPVGTRNKPAVDSDSAPEMPEPHAKDQPLQEQQPQPESVQDRSVQAQQASILLGLQTTQQGTLHVHDNNDNGEGPSTTHLTTSATQQTNLTHNVHKDSQNDHSQASPHSSPHLSDRLRYLEEEISRLRERQRDKGKRLLTADGVDASPPRQRPRISVQDVEITAAPSNVEVSRVPSPLPHPHSDPIQVSHEDVLEATHDNTLLQRPTEAAKGVSVTTSLTSATRRPHVLATQFLHSNQPPPRMSDPVADGFAPTSSVGVPNILPSVNLQASLEERKVGRVRRSGDPPEKLDGKDRRAYKS
ncbi:hypothetical protein KEM56_004100 [Ascosphaera pollenicola]|nr:hypothetical protein KEM56_004100 [Ascosphaera pollenicola]